MALISRIELSSGIVIDRAYTRIYQISGSKVGIQITTQSFVNKEIYDSGKSSFGGGMYFFVPEVDSEAKNIFQQVYEYLKTIPEFKDAIDA